MDEPELIEKRAELKKRVLILEWDKKRSQINFGKSKQLDEYKKEIETIENQLGINQIKSTESAMEKPITTLSK